MAIYNTQSCKAILGKVYRDLQIEDQNWEVDAIEWIGEALRQIGAAPAFEQREELFAAQSHKIVLPTDLMQLVGLYKVEGIDYTVEPDGSITVDSQALADATKKRVTKDNPNPDGRWLDEGLGTDGTSHPGESNQLDYYSLNQDTIHTSFEAELCILKYKGIATDDDGYPLVPDHALSNEAMFWYVVRQLTLRGYQHPELGFAGAHQMWETYRQRAKAGLNMPDPDDMERLAERWVRMVNGRFGGTRTRYLRAGATYQGEDLIDTTI